MGRDNEFLLLFSHVCIHFVSFVFNEDVRSEFCLSTLHDYRTWQTHTISWLDFGPSTTCIQSTHILQIHPLKPQCWRMSACTTKTVHFLFFFPPRCQQQNACLPPCVRKEIWTSQESSREAFHSKINRKKNKSNNNTGYIIIIQCYISKLKLYNSLQYCKLI